MNRTARTFVPPIYLVLCIIFGGSAQSIWGMMGLELLALVILVWVLAERHSTAVTLKLPYIILMLGLLLVALQLVPLPPGLWSAFPGRERIAGAYRLLGQPLPWLPISETPADSFAAVVTLLPAIAMFAAVQAGRKETATVGALIGGTVLAILVGAMQVGGGANSQWRFYPITNAGAVGFFANADHMGTLLLASIPFALALLLSGRWQKNLRGRGVAKVAMVLVGVLLLVAGIALNGSLAALLLVVPVVLASIQMFPFGWRWRWVAAPIMVLGLIAAVVAISVSGINGSSQTATQQSVQSRQQIWGTTLGPLAESFPVGTGLGSFPAVYRQYEDPDAVTAVYVNHAHNDYLELTLELGLAGALLILVFLGWWVMRCVRIWRSNLSSPFARAATIASAAILAHSVVDFPLRTATISAILGMCIAFMSLDERQTATAEPRHSRRPRHVTIG